LHLFILNFNISDEEDSEAIKSITRKEILDFYKNHINPNSKCIKKLSVHVNSISNRVRKDVINDNDHKLSADNIIINSIGDFKNEMYFGPAPTPVKDLKTYYSKEIQE
jgi:hypothetical protein